jgi:tetratricopeptide (TPR) repeat protein
MGKNVEINGIEQGKEALLRGDTLSALACFAKAAEGEENLSARSYLAFCMAKERGLISRGISWCEENIRREPENSVHFLNLGRIYLLMKNREAAIHNFREGLKHGSNEEIAGELQRLGVRSDPVISFLKRSNPLNKYLGLLLKMLRLKA